MFLLGIFNFWFLKISGPLAKAIVILDADNSITFATRIAGQFLEDFIGMADPSTLLRDPWLSRKMAPSTELREPGRGDHRGRRISWGCFAK